MAGSLKRAEIEAGLRVGLKLSTDSNIIVHANMAALGRVDGEEDAVLEAILSSAGTVIMPAFTYQTQIVPQAGPPNNALDYGTGDRINARAEIFRPDVPAHPDCGSVAEAMRRHTSSLRTSHPILSFTALGPHARKALASQTHQNPLGPIAWLDAHGGFVLMMGLDQRHNFALHLAEQRAGRRSFIRWALTLKDIEELPNIPGCMEGFNAVWRDLMPYTRVALIGEARCELIALRPALMYIEQRIREDRLFMLCDKPSCLSCRAREA